MRVAKHRGKLPFRGLWNEIWLWRVLSMAERVLRVKEGCFSCYLRNSTITGCALGVPMGQAGQRWLHNGPESHAPWGDKASKSPPIHHCHLDSASGDQRREIDAASEQHWTHVLRPHSTIACLSIHDVSPLFRTHTYWLQWPFIQLRKVVY
jgi:hypothetical protein